MKIRFSIYIKWTSVQNNEAYRESSTRHNLCFLLCFYMKMFLLSWTCKEMSDIYWFQEKVITMFDFMLMICYIEIKFKFVTLLNLQIHKRNNIWIGSSVISNKLEILISKKPFCFLSTRLTRNLKWVTTVLWPYLNSSACVIGHVSYLKKKVNINANSYLGYILIIHLLNTESWHYYLHTRLGVSNLFQGLRRLR